MVRVGDVKNYTVSCSAAAMVAVESLMEKSGDAYADSGLFIKLYEIARVRFSQPGLGEDEMWPTAKRISHRASWMHHRICTLNPFCTIQNSKGPSFEIKLKNEILQIKEISSYIN